MTEIEQASIMLRSGKLGDDINLVELVDLDIISQEEANLYIKELGSNVKVVINNKDDYADL
jgi:energy-converting hydrogenase A subunit M